MPTPWIDQVKNSKTISVFATQTVTTGPWGSIFANAIQEFNRLASAMNFGVTLVRSTDPPDANGFGGANVNFDVGNGQQDFTVLGNDFSVNVDGAGMHGHTQIGLMLNQKKQAREIVKAYTFVPIKPMMHVGPAGKQVPREAGDGVKLVIAVHELIHTCGLSNPEHSPEIDPDIFIGQPQPSPGATPKDDKLRLRLNPPNNVFAPPLIVSGRTAGMIRGNWT